MIKKNKEEGSEEKKEESINKKEEMKKKKEDNNKYINDNLNKVDVKLNFKKDFKERSPITESINKATDEHMEKFKEKKKKNNKKEEETITLDKKTEIIIETMLKMRKTKGIIYESEKMVELVVEQLVKNGKVEKKTDMNTKRRIAAKMLVDKFMVEEMRFDKEEWKDIQIESIHTGKRKNKEGKTNEIIYVELKKHRRY